MDKPWDGIISQQEQEAYRAAGFGGVPVSACDRGC